MKNVLSIAGSDPSGGAGIQADLKTMCALGVYGMAAITSVTVQNTQRVSNVQHVVSVLVEAQINAVFEDIRVDAEKVGMLATPDIIEAVKQGLLRGGARNIVLDPVMVSKSGFNLLEPDAQTALRSLVALADLVTPNIPEAEILAGFSIAGEQGMEKAARAIADLGAKAVLVKGGPWVGDKSVDMLLSGGKITRLAVERIPTKNTHGTGCTLSSAIASRLALGDSLEAAVQAAKVYVTQAIRDAYAVGKGVGPVGHMAALWRRAGVNVDGAAPTRMTAPLSTGLVTGKGRIAQPGDW
jgi:hydroxymethylpyrimidine/phosphomethylpyrimidine kinase